jgi:hypothetical protein
MPKDAQSKAQESPLTGTSTGDFIKIHAFGCGSSTAAVSPWQLPG